MSLPIQTVRNGESPAVTVNDLLIGTLVLAISSWNDAHGAGTGTIRVTLPVNARMAGNGDPGEPLGNLSRLTVIASQPDKRSSAGLLLADITRQTAAAKRAGGPQIDPVSRLLATPLLPVAVKARLITMARRVARPTTGDTTMLSNLGVITDPPDFGDDCLVTGLWVSGPARMPHGLMMGSITVRGQLHVCFRYRRALLDEPAVERFASVFRAALLSFGDPRFGASP
jgi:NRPS condensation-like uncharacterized protein